MKLWVILGVVLAIFAVHGCDGKTEEENEQATGNSQKAEEITPNSDGWDLVDKDGAVKLMADYINALVDNDTEKIQKITTASTPTSQQLRLSFNEAQKLADAKIGAGSYVKTTHTSVLAGTDDIKRIDGLRYSLRAVMTYDDHVWTFRDVRWYRAFDLQTPKTVLNAYAVDGASGFTQKATEIALKRLSDASLQLAKEHPSGPEDEDSVFDGYKVSIAKEDIAVVATTFIEAMRKYDKPQIDAISPGSLRYKLEKLPTVCQMDTIQINEIYANDSFAIIVTDGVQRHDGLSHQLGFSFGVYPHGKWVFRDIDWLSTDTRLTYIESFKKNFPDAKNVSLRPGGETEVQIRSSVLSPQFSGEEVIGNSQKAEEVWLTFLPTSPIRSLKEYSHTYRTSPRPAAPLYKPVPIPDCDLEIRSATDQKLVARVPHAECLGTDGFTERGRRRIGQLPDGKYLLAFCVGDKHCSNVAKLSIDSDFNPSTYPMLSLIPLPMEPGQTLPLLGIRAVGPTPQDPKLMNDSIAFPKLIVDGVERNLITMKWVGPVGPLESGRVYTRILQLDDYDPPIEPEKQHIVKAIVGKYESAAVVIPASDELSRQWNNAIMKLLPILPPKAELQGKVIGSDGNTGEDYEIHLLGSDGEELRVLTDEKTINDSIQACLTITKNGRTETDAYMKLVELGDMAVPALLNKLSSTKTYPPGIKGPDDMKTLIDILSEIGTEKALPFINEANSKSKSQLDQSRLSPERAEYLLDVWATHCEEKIQIWNSPDRLEQLLTALEKPYLRKWAVYKLGVLCDNEALVPLRQILNGSDQLDLRESARDSIEHIESKGIKTLSYKYHRASQVLKIKTKKKIFQVGESIPLEYELIGGEYGSTQLIRFQKERGHLLPFGTPGPKRYDRYQLNVSKRGTRQKLRMEAKKEEAIDNFQLEAAESLKGEIDVSKAYYLDQPGEYRIDIGLGSYITSNEIEIQIQ